MLQSDISNTITHNLPSLDDLVQRVVALSEINSGTSNQAGVERVAQIAEDWLRELTDQVERIQLPAVTSIDDKGQPQSTTFCDAVLAQKRPDAPRRVLLSIHLDTVYGPSHHFQNVQHRGDGSLHGPGVTDAKGGLVVMLAALRAFEQLPGASNIGWDVLLNPDEEIGSPASTALLQDSAKRADIGMVYEPCLPDGGMINRRKGSGNFTLVTRGRAAHAGREIEKGRNAIVALSQLLLELHSLNHEDERWSINPGHVVGGGPVNIVPELAVGRFNVRCNDEASMRDVVGRIESLIANANDAEGISVTLHGGFSSPPKPLTPEIQKLIDRITMVAAGMDLSLHFHASGGVCDGNKLNAVGLPTVDTLGPRGGHIHSDQEYLEIGSLRERAVLSALLLHDFAVHPEKYPQRNLSRS